MGRHRAPSKVQRNIKIIGAAVPVLALVGTLAVYEAQSGGPDHVSGNAAAFSLHTLAPTAVTDGTGTPAAGRSADGDKSKSDSHKTGKSTSARSRQAAKAGSRSDSPAKPGPTSSASSPQPSKSASPSPSPSGSSSPNLKAAVQQDIASGNYLLAVGQYLVENGYTAAAAAGVASCVDGESGGNPESVGSGGGGLIGWTPISSAEPNSNIITGNASADMMAQLEDLLYYNSTEIGQSLVNQLNTITDPVDAADFFSQNFEKPAVTDSDVVPSVAEQIYSDLTG
jgi:Phage tail lysozyme